MEIRVQPAGFAVTPTTVRTPVGEEAARQVTIVDASGIQITLVFPLAAYDEFRAFLADPEGMMERAQARSKVEVARSIPGQRH